MLIGYVHKSLKDTQSPLSPVLFLLYIFLSPVSSPVVGGLVYYDLTEA